MLNFAKGCTIGFHLHWPFNKYRRIGSYGRPRSHLANKNYFLSFPSNSVPIIYSISVYPGLAAAKSLQSCPTLRDPIVGSPPGSPVPGILQARTLEFLCCHFLFQNSLEGRNSRFKMAQERISELEDRSVEAIQTEETSGTTSNVPIS